MGSLLRSVLSILAGKSSGIVISLIFTAILVRVISQEQYGLYASILAGFSLFTLISQGGLFDACRKKIAETSPDGKERSIVITLVLTLSLLYALVSTGGVIVILISDIIPKIYMPYIVILSVSIIFANVFIVIRGVFFGVQKEHLAEIFNVSRRLLYTSTGLGLAYIGYDLWGVFFGYTLSFILITFIGILFLSRRFSFAIPSTDDIISEGKDIAVYGGFQLIGGVSAALLYNADILLVQYFKNSVDTALYKSAILPAEMIWFVPAVIQLAFLQRVAKLWTQGDIDGINKNVKIGIKYGVLSLTLFGVGLFALADPFLSVYFGNDYVGASTTLRLLILGTIFFGLSRVIIPVFQAIGWIRVTELVSAGALVLNIALNVLLIPRFGILGAGIGTTISYVAIFGGNLVIWALSPVDLVPIQWFVKLVAVQCLFAAIFITIVSLLDLSPILSLLVFPPFGLFLFTVMNLITGYIPLAPVNSILR